MTGFVLNKTEQNFFLKMTGYFLYGTQFVLNITGFDDDADESNAMACIPVLTFSYLIAFNVAKSFMAEPGLQFCFG